MKRDVHINNLEDKFERQLKEKEEKHENQMS